MTPRYTVPAQRYRCEIEVKRSRFIATVAATPTVEQSRDFIRTMQQEFPDANHNCWACVVGAPGATADTAMSDDGEPHGAAGKPMLTALQHSGLGDITVVVTRYFGGTRLGKGGMARAYTDAVLAALSGVTTKEKIDYCAVEIGCDYALLEPLQRLFDAYEVVVDDQQFADQVTLFLRLPEEHLTRFTTHITDLSHGRITIAIPV
ncbi:YigZ family protein [Desulfuromonas acetoxidans]|uniref:YigZ family protein n=1 Tax=Desulfuromonas acetoxidans TaxID=891 RepID=UPI00293166AB|nr:YigZ family protein [Desulfuromonas acetoxidans]